MYSSFIPPRQARIGDAASFVGTTPRAIRHCHQIGLLSEPGRGSDGRRRYGYDEMIQLLWIRKMADAGVALNDIRDAFAETAPAGRLLLRLLSGRLLLKPVPVLVPASMSSVSWNSWR